MKKIMAVAAIVVLVVLVGAPVAQAQYYGQSEASRAMSGGRQIMGESFVRIRGAMAREQARMAGRDMRDMGYNDPYANRSIGYDQPYPTPYGGGYGDPCVAYAGQGVPNGTRPIVYGGVGAAAGRVVSRDQRAVAIGGIIGAVVGSVKDSRDRRRANQAYVDCQATVAQQSSQRQAYQATPSRRESDRVSQQTGLTIINRVRVLVRVSVDGGDFIYIDPSDEISIPEPQDSVRAEFREVRSGRVSWKRAEVRENDKLDGFEVVLPRQ